MYGSMYECMHVRKVILHDLFRYAKKIILEYAYLLPFLLTHSGRWVAERPLR